MTPEPFHSQHGSHPAKRLTVFVEYADRALTPTDLLRDPQTEPDAPSSPV